MSLKTLVKVNSLTNLSDARYCAGMGVQLLGFQAVAGLPGHITAARFHEIRGWITGPEIVAELYGLQSRQQLDDILESFRPDYLEVGPAELPLARETSLPLLLRLAPGEVYGVDKNVAYIVAEADDTRTFEVPTIVRVSTAIDAENALTKHNVKGIMLQGSEELSPGLKTYDTLAPILEMLENDS